MKEIKNPVKAIRAFCLECLGGSVEDIRNCTVPKCPLYAFRFGKNPYREVKVLSEEHRARSIQSLALAREKKKQEAA